MKFKKGDIVKPTSECPNNISNKFKGKDGVVEETRTHSEYPYEVTFDSGRCDFFKESEIRLATITNWKARMEEL